MLFAIYIIVIESLLAPLAVIINGSIREAINGVIILENIDEQTFVRFCEFAYFRDYILA